MCGPNDDSSSWSGRHHLRAGAHSKQTHPMMKTSMMDSWGDKALMITETQMIPLAVQLQMIPQE